MYTKRIKKSQLKTCCRFSMNTVSPLKRAHQDSSNATVKVGVKIFCSVRFLPIKKTKPIFFKKNPNSIPTDRFRFGSVFYVKN
jgi:hypothetical protein